MKRYKRTPRKESHRTVHAVCGGYTRSVTILPSMDGESAIMEIDKVYADGTARLLVTVDLSRGQRMILSRALAAPARKP